MEVLVLEFNRNVLPLLVLLADQADLKLPHSEVIAQQPLPSVVREELGQLSVEAALRLLLSKETALMLLLSVDSAHRPLRDVVPPPRPPFSVVTAVVLPQLPKAVKPQAPLKDVSHLAPQIDVTVLQDLVALAVPQDLIAAPAQADPSKHPGVL